MIERDRDVHRCATVPAHRLRREYILAEEQRRARAAGRSGPSPSSRDYREYPAPDPRLLIDRANQGGGRGPSRCAGCVGHSPNVAGRRSQKCKRTAWSIALLDEDDHLTKSDVIAWGEWSDDDTLAVDVGAVERSQVGEHPSVLSR